MTRDEFVQALKVVLQEHSLCAGVREGLMEELTEARKEIEDSREQLVIAQDIIALAVAHVLDEYYRQIAEKWLLDMKNRKHGELMCEHARLRSELKAEKNEIERLKNRVIVMRELRNENDRLRSELEAETARADRHLGVAVRDDELIEGFKAELTQIRDDLHKEQAISEGLRAEVEKGGLKWREGRPNRVGWFWVKNNSEGMRVMHIGGQLQDYRFVVMEWAGPIEPPSEE